MVKAWFMHDVSFEQNPQLPHRLSDEELTLKDLEVLGLKYDYIPPEDSKDVIPKYMIDNGYNYEDQVCVSKDKMPNYEKQIRTFFEEHLHDDDEVRYVQEGSGYFDVRDLQDRWIRIQVNPGDMLVVPAGIYHRFTTDEKDYIVARRLFTGNPVWTPFNRPADDNKARIEYLKEYA